MVIMKKALFFFTILTALGGSTLLGTETKAEAGQDCCLAPEVAKYVEPSLPEDVLAAGETGKVVVKCAINEDGELVGIKTLASTHEELTEVVMEALKEWEFKAATLNGEPIRANVDIPFNFSLAKN